ncbi:hypothetical protein [Mesorhizobium amorphae]|uniref:hypothetical protein n=1 Tax=Mesorhizobium amorphae TaxID=71433 RepID=UPI0017855BCD|nr:hypothetical protein [Mesorhizobium amorphae]
MTKKPPGSEARPRKRTTPQKAALSKKKGAPPEAGVKSQAASRLGGMAKTSKAASKMVTPSGDAMDPVVAAKAEILAFNDVFQMLAARANGCGLPPTTLRRIGDHWMICFLQSDCSYGQCQVYTGPVP